MPNHRITRLDSQQGTLWAVESAIRQPSKRYRWNIVAVFRAERAATECMSSILEGREPLNGRLKLEDH
jgi:hypothetical protein